jgi:hypothetical protein
MLADFRLLFFAVPSNARGRNETPSPATCLHLHRHLRHLNITTAVIFTTGITITAASLTRAAPASTWPIISRPSSERSKTKSTAPSTTKSAHAVSSSHHDHLTFTTVN